MKIFVRNPFEVKEIKTKKGGTFLAQSAYCCLEENKYDQEKNSEYILNNKTLSGKPEMKVDLMEYEGKTVFIEDYKLQKNSDGTPKRVGSKESLSIDILSTTKISVIEEEVEPTYEDENEVELKEVIEDTSFEDVLEGEKTQPKLVEESNVSNLKPKLTEKQEKRNNILIGHVHLIDWYNKQLKTQGFTREEIITMLPSITASAFIELNKKGLF